MRNLVVTVTKDEIDFLNGTFDVTDEEYPIVEKLLEEVDMTRQQAASMLSGYMHANHVGKVTEDMGKLAMMATVYMLQAGETNIIIPL
jgi:nucleoside phosphorylase